jgi:hypothetical protein
MVLLQMNLRMDLVGSSNPDAITPSYRSEHVGALDGDGRVTGMHDRFTGKLQARAGTVRHEPG